jgi:proteasome assembly chaperone (PAC2) family protein
MTDAFSLSELPEAEEIYMLAGWRQWADAGSISSGLPKYLIQKTNARKIGTISSDGFYLFQLPGTHDLIRPLVKFNNGFPEFLEKERNEFFYFGDKGKGLVIFLGDEPHLDVERYISSLINAAKKLKVRRIIGLGGVYGELPYDKERMVSSIYSQEHLKDELEKLAVNFSEYKGGASIGSYLCRRSAEEGIEYVSFYGFVPSYNFSGVIKNINGISIENDFSAWLGIMRRIIHMLKLDFELKELEEKRDHLQIIMDQKIDEIEQTAPELNIREYLLGLRDNFEEELFHPLEDFWEEELGRLFDKIDPDEGDLMGK